MLSSASQPGTVQQPAGCQFPSVHLLGVRIHDVAADDIVAFIVQQCREHARAVVANVNVHAMDLACEQPWFREFLNRSELVFCDGFGISLASAWVAKRFLHRNTPPDWMDKLMAAAVQGDLSLYFLGTQAEVVEKAADVFRSRFPTVRIVGCHDGYFDKSRASQENAAVRADINRLQPDILVLGFGMPMQERWIFENWDDLQAYIAIPAGAMFDFVAGETYRAPRWITDHGLEWLSRLVVEPRRLWRRYIVGLPVFFWRVLLQQLGLLRLN